MPVYAAWVLGLLIVGELVHSIQTLWALERLHLAPASGARVSTHRGPVSSAGQIALAHLFGVAPRVVQLNSGATPRPLVLAGTIASDDPSLGFGILGETLASARAYSVGSSTPFGARLVQVFADHVVLERDARKEILRFPDNRLLSGVPRGLQTYSPAPPEATPPADVAGQDVLASSLNAYPTWNGNAFAGYRMNPSPKARRELGVQPDDMLMAVNGVSIHRPEDADEAVRRREAGTTITVERHGQRVEIPLRQAGAAPH